MDSPIWNALFGAGGLAFFGGVVGVIKYFIDGAKSKSAEASKQISKWQRDTVARAEWEGLQHQWWRDYAGRCVYVITTTPSLGPSFLPAKEPYPEKPKVEKDDD